MNELNSARRHPLLNPYHLTHSCPDISLTSVVCTYNTFENYLRIRHDFTKYLKKSCGLGSDQYFSFKYFLKNDMPAKISSKIVTAFFGVTGMEERANLIILRAP